ncbi:MAG: sulfotransferase [Acidobacteriota bacterium]
MKPLFIFGPGKSGTTLVGALLDGHPEVVTLPVETHVVSRLALPATRDGFDDALSAFVRARYERLAERGYLDMEYAAFRDAIDRRLGDDRDALSVLRALVMAYGEGKGWLGENTRYWGDNTPSYAKTFEPLLEAAGQEDSDFRVLHILRDPRDNWYSWRRYRDKKKPHRKWDLPWFLRRWYRSAHLAGRHLDRFGPERYRIMRYEDLVEEPEAETRRIADFLGITWRDSMLIPTRGGSPWGGNSMHGKTFQGISNSSVGRWKDALDENERAEIERCLGPEMRAHDYPPVDPSRSARVFRWRETASLWRQRRAIRSVLTALG